MPITSVTSDAKALTLTVVADYPVTVERLWDAYADPRQLEKFWGPETWPATFTRHDMVPRGQLVKMGMMEGLKSAMGQIDAVLADLASFAASRATESQILSDTQVRVSRIIRGSVNDVWRAHHEPALMKRWLLGPDGWTMPVCEEPNLRFEDVLKDLKRRGKL